MALAPTPKVILGSIAFAVFWVMAVFPAVPFLPIGRTAGTLLGAILMVIFRVITPDQAYDSIDLPILGLLFGTMVVSVYLERADMFKYIGKLLAWKSLGPKDLIFRICIISAISSAFFTNDTACVVLTEFVLKIARQHNLPPHPFLLALASSANIGSSATPIGNPQNLVIAVQSKISFGLFLVGILPAMLVGVLVNSLMIIGMYWKLLSVHKDEEDAASEVVADEYSSHRFSPATMSSSHLSPSNSSGLDTHSENLRNRVESSDNEFHSFESSRMSETFQTAGTTTPETVAVKGEFITQLKLFLSGKVVSEKWKHILWKICVYLVTAGMLIALLCGLNMSWTAITAALALVVLDFKDARPSLEKVSYSLLIFFCGMFITVDGFNKTGIPGKVWEIMEPHSQVDRVGGIAVLAVVILILSNLVSNVPTGNVSPSFPYLLHILHLPSILQVDHVRDLPF
ncbi:hypothetical protein SOVF_016970 [Spinacia oleracea]|nr:hypothetical protein SOVF_016970 [Spinacia oleracea]